MKHVVIECDDIFYQSLDFAAKQENMTVEDYAQKAVLDKLLVSTFKEKTYQNSSPVKKTKEQKYSLPIVLYKETNDHQKDRGALLIMGMQHILSQLKDWRKSLDYQGVLKNLIADKYIGKSSQDVERVKTGNSIPFHLWQAMRDEVAAYKKEHNIELTYSSLCEGAICYALRHRRECSPVLGDQLTESAAGLYSACAPLNPRAVSAHPGNDPCRGFRRFPGSGVIQN